VEAPYYETNSEVKQGVRYQGNTSQFPYKPYLEMIQHIKPENRLGGISGDFVFDGSGPKA